MAQDNKSINVSDLDFDQIKSNLKTFLRGQSDLSDYDFDGSGLSVLIDLLAYNTHYNGLYNNFAINELFLDSATKRNSVVSRAKELGYVPRSASCSQTNITMTVTATTPSTAPVVLSLPRLTPFATSINGDNYTFYTTETITVGKNNAGVYDFGEFTIKEGTPLTYKFVVADGAKYVIPNPNVDESTIRVRVQQSSSSSVFTTYNRSNSILNVTSTDTVYFLKESDDQLHEISFGDGVIGKAVSNGNIVHVDYIVTNAAKANGTRVFSYNGPSLGGTINMNVISPSFNGSDAEGIDSIKFNAPKFYAAQNRAVTTDDYKTLIQSGFSEAKSVSVWGGEDNTPPIYGKVFICIKPKSTDSLLQSQKDYIIQDLLHSKKMISITPEIIDPKYIKLGLDVFVYYNENKTYRSASDISSLVKDSVIAYGDSELESFDSIFRYSKVSRIVDTSEPSITNSTIRLKIYREVPPVYNVSAQYNINLVNPIYSEGVPEEAVLTTGFYLANDNGATKYYLVDDGIGNIQLCYKKFDGTKTTSVIVNGNIGTVDYKKGIISVANLNIIAIEGDTFEFIIKPNSNDVISVYEQLVKIDQTRLNITAIADKTSSGSSAAKNYVFTSTAK